MGRLPRQCLLPSSPSESARHAAPIGVNSRLERAYSSLQSQAGDAAITDVKVKERWIYCFVGTSYCSELQASAIQPR